jgi:hypothetical protein
MAKRIRLSAKTVITDFQIWVRMIHARIENDPVTGQCAILSARLPPSRGSTEKNDLVTNLSQRLMSIVRFSSILWQFQMAAARFSC